MSDLWHKEAVIYEVDVETFMDSDGDGIGDFPGLVARLDHLASLGVTCLWLLPMYRTPNRDNGYDISDYFSVDRRLGTPGDFVEFLREARQRGMRVMLDLVANHVSVDHPWFKEASRDRSSRYFDYFVWRDDDPGDTREHAVFPGVQDGIWTHVPEVRAWYLHHFYESQADLNIGNPNVRDELKRVMGFWLELGVAGFRVDAVPFLIKQLGFSQRVNDPQQYLTEFSDFVSWRRGDAVLLGEVNVEPAEVLPYFGGGRRLHMVFNFTLNQALFLAVARMDARPILAALRSLPALPRRCQWANFLRNHDELDLGRLRPEEREEVLAAFDGEASARIYGRGLRRRLAPMLGDERRLRMVQSLLFSLPGTPVLRYGDEIGMGDDLSQHGREAVRTPMQWSDHPNGGFSSAPEDRLVRPVVSGGAYGYQRVNVACQRREPDSFLAFTQRLIRARKEAPELGHGDLQLLDAGHPAVLAHASVWNGGKVLALHNLSDQPQSAALCFDHVQLGTLTDLLGGEGQVSVGGGRARVDLPPYGLRWFRLDEERTPRG